MSERAERSLMANPTDLDAALVLSRFGLGAREDSLAAIAGDPRGALHDELARRALAQPSGPELKATPALLREVFEFQKERKAERERAAGMEKKDEASPTRPDKMERRARAKGGKVEREAKKERPRNPIQEVFLAEADARFNGTMREPVIGFGERLAMFWANHFAIAANKGPGVRILAGAFEREAIRPHIFGRFEDMLLTVESHPAMLMFLDNQQSIGPDSRAGRRSKRGLNENLAREIMELHTLGVGSGYTQADVTSFANIITGWTVARVNNRFGAPGTFAFNPNAHEPGAHAVLGVRYPDSGLEQGRAVLRDLAHRPATAKHIAFKLARHFVADTPPPALVEAMAATFTRTGGDLPAVYRTMIESDAAWSPTLAKIRSPQEFMIALLRASGERPKPPLILGGLNAMGQPLWTPAGPNGFPDTVDAWASSEGLGTRIEVASLVANATPRKADPRRFATETLGALLRPDTEKAISRAETKAQAVAIACLSPEFQRR
jgi:uncharacterized protein (DUF1800 family)